MLNVGAVPIIENIIISEVYPLHRKKILKLLICGILALQMNAYAATGTVKTDVLNVRDGASISSNITGKLSYGEKVNITGVNSGFYRLNCGGWTAYGSSDYISVDVIYKGIVCTDSLNVRTGAGKEYSSVGKLNSGDTVDVTAVLNGWYEILYLGNLVYVSSDYISVASRDTELASRGGNSRNASALVTYSTQFIGTPYVSGGSSPAGFDCSGFTSYVYSAYGVSLPRTAAGQAGVGIEVSKGELAPGDLVFFNTYGGISHVGIYVGDDSFIHATVPGDTVKVSSMSSAYYNSRFVCARRVLR